MNCVRCLRPVEPGARWCSFCGEPVQPVPGTTQPLPDVIEAVAPVYQELPTSGAAIAALVFSIVGLIGLPLIGSLLALAFAHRARREASYGVAAGWEIARAARIVAWTGIILLVVAAGAVAGYIVWGVHQGHHYNFHFGG